MARLPLSGPVIYASDSDIPADATRRDLLKTSLEELYYIEHPDRPKPATSDELAVFYAEHQSDSVWIYYPWRNTALRIPGEATFFRLRTARNRILVSDEEQARYRNASISIAGLSVGSAALATLVRTGGPKKLRIADHDTIEITNLNRMRALLPDVGFRKVAVAAQEIWELDPFAEVDAWTSVDFGESDAFAHGSTVVIDEIDNIGMKVALRHSAKAAHVPVVMGTDNGEGVILDVERFDLEPDHPIFHGRVSLDSVPQNLSREEFGRLASQIIDPNLFTERQAAAVAALGKTLPSISQLGTAATVAGAVVAYAVRLIATGQPLASGRYILAPETALTQPLA